APALGSVGKSVVKHAGQALPVIPQVGPAPLPTERIAARRGSQLTPKLPLSVQHAARDDVGAASLPLGDVQEPAQSQTAESVASVDALTQRYVLPTKKFPILTQVGRNLTLMAALGQAD